MNNKQSFFQYGLISVFLINLIECNFLLTNYHIYSPSSISNNNNVISNHISYSGNYLFLILIKKLIIKNHSFWYIYNPDKAKEKQRTLFNFRSLDKAEIMI